MTYINEMKIQFLNKSVNEGLARVAVASFCAQLDLTVETIADIKTAVSEAVTNAIVHGYENMCGFVTVCCAYTAMEIEITVSDYGRGIEDIEKARQPFYTTCSDGTRSGMGFTVMESFMDEISIVSASEEGTRVVLTKKLGGKK